MCLPNLGQAIFRPTPSPHPPFLPLPSTPPSTPVHTRFAFLYMAPQPSSLAQSNGATTSVQVGQCSSRLNHTHSIAYTLESSPEDSSVQQSRPCDHTPSFPADYRPCCFCDFGLCRPAVRQSRPERNYVRGSNPRHKETTVHF